MDVSDLPQIIIVVIIAGALLTMSFPLFGTMADSGGGEERFQDGYRVDGGTASLNALVEDDLTVQQSLGDAARLDGSQDSYVSSATEPNVSGNFTVSTWVRVDNTSATQTVYADSQRLILYNGSSGQWVGVYYEPSSSRTWTVSQLASDPTNWTHVTLMLDGGSLELIEDNNLSSTVATNDANAVSDTFAADNLAGDLDETRVFDEPLSSSERQQLIDTPTAPLAAGDRAYRQMYDAYDKSPGSLPVLIAGGTADVGDVQLVDGFDGQSVTRGTDWSLQNNNIAVEAGGVLENAPIVYASFLGAGGVFATTMLAFSEGLIGALLLYPTVFIVIAIVFTLSVLMVLRR